MDSNDIAELKDPGTWDVDNPVAVPSVKNPRAVVSVAFSRQDFERVGAAARISDMKVSEFIREASLGRARQLQSMQRAIVYVPDEVGARFVELMR